MALDSESSARMKQLLAVLLQLPDDEQTVLRLRYWDGCTLSEICQRLNLTRDAVAWITFDPVAKEDALEFIPGSHRKTLYNGSSFALEDDTAPLIRDSDLPRLPDIQADRGGWEIVSWPVTPGDLIVFDVATLISHCSHSFTLEPDDVILTGTPWGCGEFMDPKRSLGDGDVVEVEVEGIGTLRNPVAEVAR